MGPFELMPQSLPAVINQDDKHLCAACILPLRAGVSIRSHLFFFFPSYVNFPVFLNFALCESFYTLGEGGSQEGSFISYCVFISQYLPFLQKVIFLHSRKASDGYFVAFSR